MVEWTEGVVEGRRGGVVGTEVSVSTSDADAVGHRIPSVDGRTDTVTVTEWTEAAMMKGWKDGSEDRKIESPARYRGLQHS